MKKLAIYDVDYTIISNNSLSSFMFYIIKKYPKKILYLPLFSLLTLFWLLRFIKTKKLKEFFLILLINMDKKSVESICKSFFADKILPNIKPGVKENIESNKNDGLLIIIATASFELYIKYLAEYLNIKNYFGTQVEYINNKLTSKIIGNNCKGNEKIDRILKTIPEDKIIKEHSIGFTDSNADLPFLKLTSRVFKVSRKRWKIKRIIYNTKLIYSKK